MTLVARAEPGSALPVLTGVPLRPGARLSRPGRPGTSVGPRPIVGTEHLLGRERSQLLPYLLARVHHYRSRGERIRTLHKLGGPGQPLGQADKPLREQLPSAPPAVPDGADALVVLREPVDVLDGLADPFQPADEPGLLGLEALRPRLTDRLPGRAGAGDRGHGRHASRHITDHR
jgi:hypothetical protein